MLRFLSFLLAAWLAACSPLFDSPPKPDNLLDENTMLEIIVESLLLQEKVFLVNNQYSSYANTVYKRLEKEILDRYQTDSLTYHLSYAYYAHDIDNFEKLYTRVSDTLQARKNRLATQ